MNVFMLFTDLLIANDDDYYFCMFWCVITSAND